MAIKTLEDFKEFFASGDFTPDRMTDFAEDVADTFNDYNTRLNNAKAEKDEIEKTWRQKYTNRFFEGGVETSRTDNIESDEDRASSITYNDLFK